MFESSKAHVLYVTTLCESSQSLNLHLWFVFKKKIYCGQMKIPYSSSRYRKLVNVVSSCLVEVTKRKTLFTLMWQKITEYKAPTERRAQSLVKPRKCLTSSSSQVLECDERSWPRDPKHLFSRVRHAIDHLIVRIFASFRPVHTILFDRLLCDFSFLLTVYLIQICLRFSVGTSFFLHMIRTYITICSS